MEMTETKAKRAEKPVAVGDIFCSSWGYNQTNIDYYEVVAVSKTGRAKLHAIAKTSLSDPEGASHTVGPVRGAFLGDPTGYKVVDASDRDGSLWLNICSYAVGKRVATIDTDLETVRAYETGWGYGH
jgi:hypothetical protein